MFNTSSGSGLQCKLGTPALQGALSLTKELNTFKSTIYCLSDYNKYKFRVIWEYKHAKKPQNIRSLWNSILTNKHLEIIIIIIYIIIIIILIIINTWWNY